MRKALLQRLATESAAGSDSPFARSSCAAAVSTADTCSADGQQLQGVVAVDTPLGFIGGERSANDATGDAAPGNDVEGEHRVDRDDFF